MNRSRLLAGALAVAFVGAGTLAYFQLRSRPHQSLTASKNRPMKKKAPPAQEAEDEVRFELPPEPEGPGLGSPARVPYYQAMVAGDQRALELARRGLADTQGGPGPASPGQVRRLQEMERLYAQRLARHQQALDESTPARHPASARRGP